MIYDKSTEYKVYICESKFFPGSGDYEDEAQIQNDRYIKCYEIVYETISKEINSFSLGGHYEKLEEAIKEVEGYKQFKKWI